MPATPRVTQSPDTRHEHGATAKSRFRSRRDAVLESIQRRNERASAAPARRPKAEAPAGAGGRRSRSPLGSNAKTTAAPKTPGQEVADTDETRRASRYHARRWLSTVTNLDRISKCGRVSVIQGGEVLLKVTETADKKRHAGFGGLSTCASVWVCPVCSAKIAAQRTQEIEKLLAWNAARGGSVALATFTMSHTSHDRLRQLRDALQGAWSHITDARLWKKERKKIGMDGYVRAIECTITEDNGWHLHIHVLMIFDGPVTQEHMDEWTDDLYSLWSDGLAQFGMTASRKRGVDVRIGTGVLDGLGKYLSKLTYETAGQRWKKGKGQPLADGRSSSRTPFQLLDDVLLYGRADDMERWWEWEKGSKGMRQLQWSDGLKKKVLVEEVTDQDAAEADAGGDTVMIISPTAWKTVYKGKATELLEAAEISTDQAFEWMDERDLAYEEHAGVVGIHGPALPPKRWAKQQHRRTMHEGKVIWEPST